MLIGGFPEHGWPDRGWPDRGWPGYFVSPPVPAITVANGGEGMRSRTDGRPYVPYDETLIMLMFAVLQRE
jgi:hypothetical protein